MAFESQNGERRRSERVLLRTPVKVSGVGPNGKPVNEKGEAVILSQHGALLRLPSSLMTDTTLDIMVGYSQEVQKCRVVWVSEEPKDGHYEIGIEILTPRDEFWGIRFLCGEHNS